MVLTKIEGESYDPAQSLHQVITDSFQQPWLPNVDPEAKVTQHLREAFPDHII